MLSHSQRWSCALAREWGVAPCLTGRQVKLRIASWRAHITNPTGRVCLHPVRRHHSVVYRHTLPRSSLVCAQSASSAGHGKAWSGLHGE